MGLLAPFCFVVLLAIVVVFPAPPVVALCHIVRLFRIRRFVSCGTLSWGLALRPFLLLRAVVVVPYFLAIHVPPPSSSYGISVFVDQDVVYFPRNHAIVECPSMCFIL